MDTIDGVPVHLLIVHAAVVLVPVSAVVVLLAATVPRFRSRARWAPLILALLANVAMMVSSDSGHTLEDSLAPSPLIERHAALASDLGSWMAGVGLVAFAETWVWRRERAGVADRLPGRRVVVAVAVLSVVMAVGTVQQVVRVGHSGAQSVWTERDSG